MSSPLFSIIIPTFNAGKKIIQTLDSIRAQNFSDLEIVVQDGASTDGTRAFLQAQNDVNWCSESDGGIYDAMNRAVSRAKGQFLIFLGAGDILENGVLAQLTAEIARHRENSNSPFLLYGDVWWEVEQRRHGGEFGQWRLTRKNVCHQGMILQAELFERLELYDTRYSNCADWAWNIRAWGDDEIAKIYLPLLIARYEGGGQSESSRDGAFNADVLAMVQQNFRWPVKALYTLRRAAPQGLKNLLRRRVARD